MIINSLLFCANLFFIISVEFVISFMFFIAKNYGRESEILDSHGKEC